jgi:hypothetical protein
MSVLEIKNMAEICKLCQKPAELQDSHIIPEFFCKLIYDSNPRRFRVISADPSVPVQYEQKGLREPLLCNSCEGKFGRWEDYAKRTFVDGKNIQIVQTKGEILIQNIDYKKFKLLQLSLLWRMSVSKSEFFKTVSLGQKHEEKLRQALLSEDPLGPKDYPCALELLTLGGNFYQDWILQPYFMRGQFRVYRIVITGIRYSFFVGGCAPPAIFVSCSINQKNELLVGMFEIRDEPFLHEAVLKLGEAVHFIAKHNHEPARS